MFFRLVRGIANGVIAHLSIGANRLTNGGHRSWLARRAALAVLRMYRLGGGIDDGAAQLLGSWGDEGQHCLAQQIKSGELPEKYQAIALLLVDRRYL